MDWWIYALVDPRDGGIRYVGYSSDVTYRYKKHTTNLGRKDAAPVLIWVRELKTLGLMPGLSILEHSTGDDSEQREAYWISQYPNLLNSNTPFKFNGARKRATEEEYIERFWSKVNKHSGHFYLDVECWEWTAGTNSKGYGYFWYNGKTIQAHQLAWAFTGHKNPVDQGLELDHLCRNHLCVNPSHLDPVTRRTNQRRGLTIAGINLSKSHCPQGHAYNGDNLRINSTGGRCCVICARHASKKWYAANREAYLAKLSHPRQKRTHCKLGHKISGDNAKTFWNKNNNNYFTVCRICDIAYQRAFRLKQKEKISALRLNRN